MELTWHVGDVVRKLREARRWNQSKLAKEAGVNKATVVAVEDHAPGVKRETYEKIARAFQISIAELYALVPSQPPITQDELILAAADIIRRRAQQVNDQPSADKDEESGSDSKRENDR